MKLPRPNKVDLKNTKQELHTGLILVMTEHDGELFMLAIS